MRLLLAQLLDQHGAIAIFEEGRIEVLRLGLKDVPGWGDAWRDGVYDYLHFHSRIHEVMGVCRGTAAMQFGGKRGHKLRVKKGDVIVLPAGTGHQCLSSSKDFLVVGAYAGQSWFNASRWPSRNACDRIRRR